MSSSEGPVDLKSSIYRTVRIADLVQSQQRPDEALVPICGVASLMAMLEEPGEKPRMIRFDKPWLTMGGSRDDICILDPHVGPGQIVLRPQGDRLLIECSPVSAGVVMGGITVYRGILTPGSTFAVGATQVTLLRGDSPGEHHGGHGVTALVPHTAPTYLERVQPVLGGLTLMVDAVRTGPRAGRVALVACSLLVVSMVGTKHVAVDAECELMPQSRSWVRAPVAGFLRGIRVKEGDVVRKGDTLLQIAVPDVDRELARVEHDLVAAESTVALAEHGARPLELLAAKERQRSAETKARYLERRRRRTAVLARQGLESRQALEDAAREADGARGEAELAIIALQQLEAGLAPEQIAGSRAERDKLRAERDFLKQQRGLAEIRSPSDGIVATPKTSELEAKFVAQGAELLVVLDGQHIVFDARVPEKEIEFVRIGDPVRIRLRGTPQHPIDGQVEEIGASAMDGPLGRVIPVRCRTQSLPAQALAGLTGNASIKGERFSLLRLLGKRMYRWIRTDLL